MCPGTVNYLLTVNGLAFIGVSRLVLYGERQYGAEDFAGHRWTFTETLSDTDPQTWGGQYLNPD